MTSPASTALASLPEAEAGTAARRHVVVDSPVGPITLVATRGRLAGLYMDVPGHAPAPATLGELVGLGSCAGPAADPGNGPAADLDTGHADPCTGPADPCTGPAADLDAELLGRAAGQLSRYFAGTLTSFDLPLLMAGTSFQRRVWGELRNIPYGETISYGELARRIGQPSASRAVGLANGRNPVSIVVPCHRVIGASGDLTGYGGGLERKRFLLALERRADAIPATLW